MSEQESALANRVWEKARDAGWPAVQTTARGVDVGFSGRDDWAKFVFVLADTVDLADAEGELDGMIANREGSEP